eukprot:Rmarinus@m.15699
MSTCQQVLKHVLRGSGRPLSAKSYNKYGAIIGAGGRSTIGLPKKCDKNACVTKRFFICLHTMAGQGAFENMTEHNQSRAITMEIREGRSYGPKGLDANTESENGNDLDNSSTPETSKRPSSADLDDDEIPLSSAIAKGTGTLSEKDMPFVNRLEELLQVFVVNAQNIIEIISSDRPIKNYRQLDLLFCVQYFGSGKTTLGEQFPLKVQTDSNFRGFVLEKLKKQKSEDLSPLQPEWRCLRDRGIGHVFIDVGSAENIVHEAATVAAGGKRKHVSTDLSISCAAQSLVSYASTHGPTLFHFDEVGAKEKHSLDELRFLVREVWKQMWQIKNTEGAGNMPRVYFLVTGKSTEHIGGGTQFHPCGSHFLVLDMLSSKCIGEVRRHMMGLKLNPLKLNHLRETDASYLDQRLAGAT